MYDIKWIRDNPDAFDAGLTRRGIAPGGDVKFAAELLALDERRRAIITELQTAQSLRNARSRVYGKAKAANDQESIATLTAELAESKEVIANFEQEQRAIEEGLKQILSVIPNTPCEDVPEGKDEHGNVEVRKEVPKRPGDDEYNRRIDKTKTPPKLAGVSKPLQHFEIGERLGLMDFETAAKLSGARFVVLKGALARMERALGAFMLDIHTAPEKGGIGGYTEVAPPILVRDDAMFGTAQLPKFAEDQFAATTTTQVSEMRDDAMRAALKAIGELREAGILNESQVSRILAHAAAVSEATPQKMDRWLIPTAEVPLTNLVREKITDEAELPIRVTAFTPCFRAEAGAAGKDTRGMIRQHQFSKVELVSITTPEQSGAEHERMTACAEEVLKRLGLAYRTMLLCTGDMGFASQKTYDIEVWLPGQDTYREISSCSVCGDFQARRMNARYRPKGGKDTRFVHTLNGSGLAVGRTMVAILENYQQADGSVAIPDALVPYMGGMTRIEAA